MKYFVSAILVGSTVLSSTAFATDTTFSQKAFIDVPTTSANFTAIEYLRTQNVIKGYPDGKFGPTRRVTRGELVKFIANPFILDTNRINECLQSEELKNSTTAYFPDVQKTDDYAVEVCFSKTKNLISGYPDGKFRPGNPVSFVEAAKILANVFAFEIGKPTEGDQWYKPYVQRLSDLHAIPATIKRFDQPLTRGEMAEIVYRLKANNTTKASASIGNLR